MTSRCLQKCWNADVLNVKKLHVSAVNGRNDIPCPRQRPALRPEPFTNSLKSTRGRVLTGPRARRVRDGARAGGDQARSTSSARSRPPEVIAIIASAATAGLGW